MIWGKPDLCPDLFGQGHGNEGDGPYARLTHTLTYFTVQRERFLHRAEPSPSWTALRVRVQDLEAECARIPQLVAQLREQEQLVHELVGRIEMLESAVDPPDSDEDQVQSWLASNSDVLEEYAGRVVAIHPSRGVVAAGDTVPEAVAAAREGNVLDDVVIHVVSSQPSCG